jgi:hypothetical protein
MNQHLGVLQKHRKDRTRRGQKMRMPLFIISLTMVMVLDLMVTRIARRLEIHSHVGL